MTHRYILCKTLQFGFRVAQPIFSSSFVLAKQTIFWGFPFANSATALVQGQRIAVPWKNWIWLSPRQHSGKDNRNSHVVLLCGSPWCHKESRRGRTKDDRHGKGRRQLASLRSSYSRRCNCLRRWCAVNWINCHYHLRDCHCCNFVERCLLSLKNLYRLECSSLLRVATYVQIWS